MSLLQTNVAAGEVDVGDTKTIEVFAEDGSGSKLPDPNVEVVVTSPSSTETTYTNQDLSESDRRYYLDLTFDEPGYWHVRIKLSSGGGTETESGWVRATAQEPEEVSLLTRDVWHQYLSEEAMEEGPERLFGLIEAAERKVVDRYRETRPQTGNLVFSETPAALGETYVRLTGWEEDGGEPDLQAINDELLDALRTVVASVVEHEIVRPDEHVLRVDQGERRVDYKEDAGNLPPKVYSPLRPFDERTPFML